MIELKEKANNFAEENILEVLKEACSKVYAEGYRDGYKDRDAEISVDLRDNKTEYIDLGLPSGTLWAKNDESIDGKRIYLPYVSALHMYLPTAEQWNELQNDCLWTLEDGKFCCTGPNGNVLKFSDTGFIKGETIHDCKDEAFFGIYSSTEDEHKVKCANIFVTNKLYTVSRDLFTGLKIPIRQVKKQTETV